MAPIVETRKREVVALKVLTRLNLLVADPEATVEALCVRREPEVVYVKYVDTSAAHRAPVQCSPFLLSSWTANRAHSVT